MSEIYKVVGFGVDAYKSSQEEYGFSLVGERIKILNVNGFNGEFYTGDAELVSTLPDEKWDNAIKSIGLMFSQVKLEPIE